jgi:uncharacterized membrane protein YhaH (DUF805 family)
MSWFLVALKKYATFSGRARRREYWFFVLFYVIILVVLGFVEGLIGLRSGKDGVGVLSAGFALAMLIPSLAVAVRRLHDIGRTGWWVLIGLVPLIGPIVLLVFAVLDSQPGDNEYGPNPKAAG